MTLVRLGIRGFRVADHDKFELANFNRQVGASMSTLGMSKVDVMSTMARDVNPELDHDASRRYRISQYRRILGAR